MHDVRITHDRDRFPQVTSRKTIVSEEGYYYKVTVLSYFQRWRAGATVVSRDLGHDFEPNVASQALLSRTTCDGDPRERNETDLEIPIGESRLPTSRKIKSK